MNETLSWTRRDAVRSCLGRCPKMLGIATVMICVVLALTFCAVLYAIGASGALLSWPVNMRAKKVARGVRQGAAEGTEVPWCRGAVVPWCRGAGARPSLVDVALVW